MRADGLALFVAVATLAAPALAGDAPRKAEEKAATEAAAPDAELLEFLGEFTAGEEWVDPIALGASTDRSLDRAPRKKTSAPADEDEKTGAEDVGGGQEK